MPVTDVLDVVADHLATVLPAGTDVGIAEPADAADLPAVSVWLATVTPSLPGTGRQPAAVRTGALAVERSIDLADPVLEVDGEEIPLLSGDRRVLQLPHGSIVRADGTDGLPFTTGDLEIRRGATTFVPVAGVPAAGECRPEPTTGEVTFGAALPATGVLQLRYFVGVWESTVERYAGELHVDTFAASPQEVADTSALVVGALQVPLLRAAGIGRLDPTAVSPITPTAFAGGRRRGLTYQFESEIESAVAQTGGGPIGSVAVHVEPGAEALTVT